MLVNNFSSVDHAIEVARNDLDLVRTKSEYTAEWDEKTPTRYLAERATLKGANASQILV